MRRILAVCVPYVLIEAIFLQLDLIGTFWGVALIQLVNTLMFQFISIPMAENRLAEYKAGFADYVSDTNKLLPFARRKSA